MARIYPSAQALIGNTPMLALSGIQKEYTLSATILAKLECWNPAGSVKDRAALSMILDAEEKGRKVTPAMLEKFTSDGEKSRLGADPQDAFLRLWVLKEAQSKLTGRGMGNWLKDTDFDPFDQRIQEINGCYVAVLEDTDAV